MVLGFRNELKVMSSNQILDKESIKRSILEGLANEPEIDRILIFGSFLNLLDVGWNKKGVSILLPIFHTGE